MSFFPRIAGLWLLAWGVLFPTGLAAQSRQSSSSAPVPALNEQQRAGEGLFLQNCALCHLPKKENRKNPVEAGPTIGPSLSGLFRGANPRREEVVRQFIQQGSPQKMPGFQYGLEPKEIDAVLAYLKTL
ncbi:MAG: hypothetical protein A3J28_15010 [Acidobacteria bacterium RIFCSPLOWO2_12_FULL_60_22]|nr:MAG: hypothetical protein A3J28_15010 [Acidobacteria bacterium RIFCSPLOWO2_12_FULL_60_22]